MCKKKQQRQAIDAQFVVNALPNKYTYNIRALDENDGTYKGPLLLFCLLSEAAVTIIIRVAVAFLIN